MKLILGVVIFFLQRSPPTRGRGLKLQATEKEKGGEMSPPTRGRGLKLDKESLVQKKLSVAPHAGAWIETGNDRKGDTR